jgi:hypothetical protein
VRLATLVEGPSDAHLVYQLQDPENGTIDVDITCNIGGGLATCTADKGYDTTPVPLGTAAPILVQGSAGAPSSTSGASAGATPGSSGASLPSNTGTASASPSQTGSASPSSSTSGGVRASRVAPFGIVAAGVLSLIV